jgi:beta-lactamase class A
LLEAEVARLPAEVGIYVKDLTTGEEAGVRADKAFNSASVIKIPVMMRAFQLADRGLLDLDARHEVTRGDLVPGSGVLQHHDLGARPTLRDVLTEMIITSDNTATRILLREVGGRDAMNEWLAASGYAATTVGPLDEPFRALMERLDPSFAALTAEQLHGLIYSAFPEYSPVFALYEPMFASEGAQWLERMMSIPAARLESAQREWIADPTSWGGTMTPRETGAMLEAMVQGTAASEESSDRMQKIMMAQLWGARRIPHFLAVPVAHKTGDLLTVANDVGIIYAASGPIVLAFFSTGIEEPMGQFEDRIGHISQLIVDYFAGAR